MALLTVQLKIWKGTGGGRGGGERKQGTSGRGRTRVRCNAITFFLAICEWTVCQQLHWLPIKSCIDFRILLLTFKILHNLAPSYLAELIHIYTPPCRLWSSSTIQLFTPSANQTTMGSRAFSRSAPSLWNSLPPDIRTSDTVSIYKSRLIYSKWLTLYQTNHTVTLLPVLYYTLLHYSHPGSSTLPNPARLTSCMVRTTESEFCAELLAPCNCIFLFIIYLFILIWTKLSPVFVVLLFLCAMSLSVLELWCPYHWPEVSYNALTKHHIQPSCIVLEGLKWPEWCPECFFFLKKKIWFDLTNNNDNNYYIVLYLRPPW